MSCIGPRAQVLHWAPHLLWPALDPSTTAWEKGLVMCHMSACQVLNPPTY